MLPPADWPLALPAQGLTDRALSVCSYPCTGGVAIVSVFFDRTHDKLFDIVDCNVVASLDTGFFAYILDFLRMT